MRGNVIKMRLCEIYRQYNFAVYDKNTTELCFTKFRDVFDEFVFTFYFLEYKGSVAFHTHKTKATYCFLIQF